MRRSWQLLSPWVALVLGGSLGIGGALIASLWVSPPLAALMGGGIAAVSAVASGHCEAVARPSMGATTGTSRPNRPARSGRRASARS